MRLGRPFPFSRPLPIRTEGLEWTLSAEAARDIDAMRAQTRRDESVSRVTPTKEMIASNVPAQFRVAPSLEGMSIIDGLYEFAERLRRGSTITP